MIPSTIAFIGSLGWGEMILIALIGLLIFGKRLPEVGKSLGKGIVEFKKGLAGIEDDVDQAGSASGSSAPPSQPSRKLEHHADMNAVDTHDQISAAVDQKDHVKS